MHIIYARYFTNRCKCNAILDSKFANTLRFYDARTFEQAIPCEESDLNRLTELFVSNKIELKGQCSKPEGLAGRSLAEAIDGRLESLKDTDNHRSKRSIFNQTSIYNFTGTVNLVHITIKLLSKSILLH